MGSLRACQDLNLFTVLIESARFMRKHAISVKASVLNVASHVLCAFAQEETKELNTLLRKQFATFCNCFFDPKRKCRVDHNIRSSHLARCKSQQLRAHVTAAANLNVLWSPDELALDLKSSVFFSQRYALNRLFVQRKTLAERWVQHFVDDPRARRDPRCDAFYRHLNSFDA